MSKQVKQINIKGPENLDSLERKWTDLQYIDKCVNALQQWLVINGIDLDPVEALEDIAFKLIGSPLTTYNQLSRDKGKTSTFFSFMRVMRNFLIAYTTKDLLWNCWKTANPHQEGIHIGIKTFSSWSTEMQLRVINKSVKRSI